MTNNKISTLTQEAMLRDLQKIQKTMHDLSHDHFMQCCKEWVHHRKNTLSVLNELQMELDSIHTKFSAARVIGTGVKVLGGLAAIVGFGLRVWSPEMKELGNELMKYGGGAGIVGGAAAGVADTTEYMLNKKIITKVQMALKEDEQFTTAFLSWFNRSQELENLFQNVFGCSILSQTTSEVFNVVEDSKVICDRGGKFLLNVVNTLSDIGEKLSIQSSDRKHMKRMLQTANDKTKFLLEQFCNDQQVRNSVWSIYEFVKKAPIIFDVAKIGVKVSRKLTSLNTTISMRMPPIGRSLLQATSNIAEGLFLALTLAISVTALISAAKDLKEGKFKYTKMLNDVKSCLSCELNFLIEEYPTVRLIR